MKKIILTLIVVAFAANAYAAAPSRAPKGFSPTKNVTVTADVANSAFAAAASHASGDKAYWTSSAFGGIGQKTIGIGAGVGTVTAPSSSTDSTIDSSYTTM